VDELASIAAPPLVVVGASTGGVEALRTLCAGLPADFPAAVLVVLHVDSHSSILPGILSRSSVLPVSHARDGEPLIGGRIYVAPPDHHLTVTPNLVTVARGPKEHFTRPAVDPLFRSAAEHHGPRVMGVVLTGDLNDGTEGLLRIRQAGGRTMVQDPDEAIAPSMPRQAMLRGAAEIKSPLADIPRQLSAWCDAVMAEPSPSVGHMNIYQTPAADPHSERQTLFVCPSCKGSLRRTENSQDGFDCYVGHRFTLVTLAYAQNEQTEAALWTAYRALCEKSFLLRLLAEEAASLAQIDDAGQFQAQAGDAGRLAVLALAIANEAAGTLAQAQV
jgi:two-component system, chemotaxis family, protein-glutamate methylesterase/glutaminase